MRRALLEELLAERAARRAVVLVTDVDSGEQWLLRADGTPGAGLGAATADAVRDALRRDRSSSVEDGGRTLFLNVFNPPLRMIVVGAVHIAQPLARIAEIAGFDVTVVDPRAAFAAGARFPEISVRREWPDEAIEALAPDARTAIVTLTHDPKLDDPGLQAALRSPAFYVGSLGSSRTHAARLARLRAAGFDDAAVARIHGPVGLSIGAASPAEIAVSIVAQVIERMRTRVP